MAQIPVHATIVPCGRIWLGDEDHCRPSTLAGLRLSRLNAVSSMEFVFIALFASVVATHSLANFSTIANVVTSLPFIVVGFTGIRYLVPGSAKTFGGKTQMPFVAFVLSLTLVGAGSVFYHLFPSTEHLLWDRLPIALCLAAFACAIADAARDSRIGSALLGPAVVVSVSSVLYWHATAVRGHEDLRPYAAVQVAVMLWAGASVFRQRARHAGTTGLRWALAAYALGRILELFQQEIYDRLGLDVGHPLKHLFVALAAFLVVRALTPSVNEPETALLQLPAASLD